MKGNFFWIYLSHWSLCLNSWLDKRIRIVECLAVIFWHSTLLIYFDYHFILLQILMLSSNNTEHTFQVFLIFLITGVNRDVLTLNFELFPLLFRKKDAEGVFEVAATFDYIYNIGLFFHFLSHHLKTSPFPILLATLELWWNQIYKVVTQITPLRRLYKVRAFDSRSNVATLYLE